MAEPRGVLGARVYISGAAIASTIDSESEFTAQTWTEIGLVTNLGEHGRVYQNVPIQTVFDGRTRKLRGGFDDGGFAITMAQDLADAGQALLRGAANASTQDNWGLRIEYNDPPSSVGGPSFVFFRGLPMSFRTTLGAANSVLQAMCDFQINADIIQTDPAELYDQFVTGGSLAHYFLVDGTDPQAIAPAISANTLVAISGDAGTGFAADGAQLIGNTGYTLSGATTIVETRLKLSAITNAYLFFGLTDQKVALVAPIESAASADTITTNAANAIGFMFDTSMATDNIWLVGVNANVDETSQNSAIAPVADTYLTLRLSVNSAGDATFYINGVATGSRSIRPSRYRPAPRRAGRSPRNICICGATEPPSHRRVPWLQLVFSACAFTCRLRLWPIPMRARMQSLTFRRSRSRPKLVLSPT
jgi:hypothetical protein